MHLTMVGFAFAATVFLPGCAGSRPEVPAPYTVVITAEDGLNADRSGKAAPVQITLFRLRGTNAFTNADFFSLYEKSEQLLGGELVSKEVLTLRPGEARVVLGKAGSEERALGVFVAYRDLDKAIWRGIAPLPAPKEPGRFSVFTPSFESAYVKVNVGASRVSVTSNVSEAPVPTGGRSKPTGIPNPPGGLSLPLQYP